jgi:hypothetical protein
MGKHGISAVFHFWYVRDTSAEHGEIKLLRSDVFSNTDFAVVETVKGEVLKSSSFWVRIPLGKDSFGKGYNC